MYFSVVYKYTGGPEIQYIFVVIVESEQTRY